MSVIKRPRIGWRDADAAFDIVAGVNDVVAFSEGAGILTNTIAAGTYSDLEIASLIKQAMDAAVGASGTYGVWRDGEDDLFYVERLDQDSGVKIYPTYGAAVWGDLGFEIVAVVSGEPIIGAFPVPAMLYLDLDEPVRRPVFTPETDLREDLVSLSGRQRSCNPRQLVKLWEADLTFHGFSALDAFWQFCIWAMRGAKFRWWPAYDAPHRWVEVQAQDKPQPFEEQLPLFKRWTLRWKMRQAANNQGTIEMEDLQNR